MFLQFSDVLHNFNPDFINHIKQNAQNLIFINHTKQNPQNPDFIWYD